MNEPPRRVNYFLGMVLGVEDFRVEQEYHRNMRYLDNRLHGYGTVEGLTVAADGDCVSVSPGWALDAQGREVVVVAPLCLDITGITASRKSARELLLTWAETPDRSVPGPNGENVFTRWVEQPELSLCLPNAAPAHALVLARLTRRRRGVVTVDESMRRWLDRCPHEHGPEQEQRHGARWIGPVCLILGGAALGAALRLPTRPPRRPGQSR